MRPLASALLLLPLLTTGVFGLTGCTLLGLALDSSSEQPTPAMEAVPDQDIPKLEHSTHIQVIKKDSTRLEGDFIRLDIMPPETVSAWYGGEGESAPTDSLLPGFGQSIMLKVDPEEGGPTCWGTFYGVDPCNLYWRDRISARVVKTPFDRVIKLMYGNGNEVAGSEIPTLVHQAGTPNIAAIWLHSGALIPLRDVARVEVKARTGPSIRWTYVGLAVDCVALAVGAIAWSQLSGGGFGGWGH